MLSAGSLVIMALAVLQVRAAPRTNVTCVDQLWSFNSLNQSPCLVSAYLSAQCTSDNNWLVPEIGTAGPYSPPSGVYASVCRCNSVQWNLLSACSLCQGGPSGTWSQWIGNCSQSVINVGSYPEVVPVGIAIPHWAYYDFTGTGVFNAEIAQQQSGPESLAPFTATSTGAAVPASGTTTRHVQSSSATAAPSKSSSGSNTGAIVGGVLGGILGLALLALIAFIVVRKSNKRPVKEDQYDRGGYSLPVAPMTGQYQPNMPHGSTMSGPGYKPYDPSDAAPFPSTQPNSAMSQYPRPTGHTRIDSFPVLFSHVTCFL